MKKIIRTVLAVLSLAHLVSMSKAQENPHFVIGDKAPEIKYSKWLKGTPVTAYKKDHLYVIECWATWCGPCIAAMPHLSELAKKYEGKVTFVGLNVWEKIPEGQSYDTVLPNVTKFVTSLGDKMSYNVAVDSKDRFMAKEYLAKSKAPGIPTTFLIKNGKFFWIGHPGKVEEIIVQVMNGTYDIEGARKGHIASIELSEKSAETKRKTMQPIETAIAAKQYDKAFGLIDEIIAKDPMQKYTLNIQKFNILLDNVSEVKALAFVEEWKKKDGERVAIYPSQSIADKKGLSKETYIFAAESFNKASGGSTTVNPMFYELAARCYSLAGDFGNAITLQQKAVDVAREGLKAGRFVGVIHDYTLTEYEQKLKEYQAKSSK